MSVVGSGRAEIDGVPLLLGRAIDGRCAGGLVFRVGVADETLATRGITHLVEHLALNQTDPTKVHANGTTGADLTHFHVSGSSDEVRDFLNHVTASLRTLPLERMSAEIEILRTEEAGRGVAPGGSLPTWRYGAQGYGLTSYDEFGLRRLSTDEVASWVTDWFTAGNCMAWLAVDEMPGGLDLRLPEGPRRPQPRPTPVLDRFPSYYQGGPAGVVVSESLVPRTADATVYASVLEQVLYRDLRQEGGVSYRVAAQYEPLDADTATVVAMADSLPDKQSTLVNRFLTSLAGLRDDVPEDMLVAAIGKRRTFYEQPNVETMRLPSDAASILYGTEPPPLEELVAELDEVDAAGVREVAARAFDTLLLQTPTTEAELGALSEAPRFSGRRVSGTRHPLSSGKSTIVIGDEGVSTETPDGVATVLWEDVVGVLSYPDGLRSVIGRDGFFVAVDARRLSVKGASLAAVIDRHVPSDLTIPMPPRAAEEAPSNAAGAPPRGFRRWLPTAALIALVALCVVLVVAALVGHLVPGAVVVVVLAVRVLPRLYRRLRR